MRGYTLKVVLSYLSDSTDTREFASGIMPSGLFHIGAHLNEKGHEVVIINLSHCGERKAIKMLNELSPDIVAFSVFSHNRIDTLKLARDFKKNNPDTMTVVGGPFVAALGKQLSVRYPEIDFLAPCEGGSTLVKIVNALGRKKKIPQIVTLAASDMIDALKGIYSFSGKAVHVNLQEQYKYFSRTLISEDKPDAVKKNNDDQYCIAISSAAALDEIQWFYEKHGIIYFTMRDERFVRDSKAVDLFCQGIIERQLYIMWSCQIFPGSVDLPTLLRMKRAGCERIIITSESGSDRMLKTLGVQWTSQMIEQTSELVRKAGLYLTLYLRVGFHGETRSDKNKNISLIRTCLPGEGIVAPAVYYPGTESYAQALAAGLIAEDDIFDRKGGSLYMRSDPEVRSWVDEVRSAFGLIRKKAWYRERDFLSHRKQAEDIWVTDLLEGDYFLDEDDHRSAEKYYLRVASSASNNPWGFMRLGKNDFRSGAFDSAGEYYRKVTEIIPQYFGGWLKLAESLTAQGKKREGKDASIRAYELNPWDTRVVNLRNRLTAK
jgi:radical SAM superfamily enzyme YgiQ (UPF0313 family)